MLKITGLKLPLGFREGDLKRAAAKQLRLPESAIGQVRLCKKSVDARKKDNVHFVCAVEAAIQGDENRLLSRRRDYYRDPREDALVLVCDLPDPSAGRTGSAGPAEAGAPEARAAAQDP